jgi:ADP-ribose pyrophosphatase YjhB (NUDIX family)
MRRLAVILQKVPWLVAWAHVVWRFRQPKFSMGVVGVMFNEEGKVLLVEHVFHPLAPWGPPGGWVDRNEHPSETVRRELREELDLSVEVGDLLLLEIDNGNHLDLAYLCRPTSAIGALSNELLDYGWYDPAQLPRLHKFHYRAIMRALDVFKIPVNEKP